MLYVRGAVRLCWPVLQQQQEAAQRKHVRNDFILKVLVMPTRGSQRIEKIFSIIK